VLDILLALLALLWCIIENWGFDMVLWMVLDGVLTF